MRRPGARTGALVVGLALALTLGLGACGDDGGSDEDRLAQRLEQDFDLPAEQAGCVAREVYSRFTTDEIETLSETADADDLPEPLLRRLRSVLTPCAGAGS